MTLSTFQYNEIDYIRIEYINFLFKKLQQQELVDNANLTPPS